MTEYSVVVCCSCMCNALRFVDDSAGGQVQRPRQPGHRIFRPGREYSAALLYEGRYRKCSLAMRWPIASPPGAQQTRQVCRQRSRQPGQFLCRGLALNKPLPLEGRYLERLLTSRSIVSPPPNPQQRTAGAIQPPRNPPADFWRGLAGRKPLPSKGRYSQRAVNEPLSSEGSLLATAGRKPLPPSKGRYSQMAVNEPLSSEGSLLATAVKKPRCPRKADYPQWPRISRCPRKVDYSEWS